MGHKIQYKLNQGDVLKYQKEVTLLLQEADGTASKGTLLEDMVETVVSDLADGTWKVRLNSRMKEVKGALDHDGPAERETLLTIDSKGTILEVSPETALPSVPTFPAEALEEDQAWTALSPTPGSEQPLQLSCYVEEYKQVADDLQAQIVTTGRSRSEEEACTVETQSSLLFSVTHGHQIESATVVKMNWDDGRTSHTVVEVKLAERSSG